MAATVFILWQRLGSVLGRRTSATGPSGAARANCRGSASGGSYGASLSGGSRVTNLSGAVQARGLGESSSSLEIGGAGRRARRQQDKVTSNHLLERPLLIRRRRRRRPLAGPERRDLRPQRRVLALQRTSLKSQRREVAARSQGGPLVNGRRHLVPCAVQAFRPLGPPQVPRRPRATDRHGMRRRA